MSHLTENSNIGAQKCSFAQLGQKDAQLPCNVQALNENLQFCLGCGRYSSAIPAKCAGVLEETEQARELIASLVSGESNSTAYRPLSLNLYRNNMEMHWKNAELMNGDGVDPSEYITLELAFSGGLSMVVRLKDLQASAKSEYIGMPFDHDLVEDAVGKLSDEEFHAAKKLLATGWGFRDAESSADSLDGHARLFFYKGYERKYPCPDGTEKTVFYGIRATIEKG